MSIYKELYYSMFNAVTRTISALEKIISELKKEQQRTEQIYIDYEPALKILKSSGAGNNKKEAITDENKRYIPQAGSLTIRFSNLSLLDRVYELSIEYSTSPDLLVNVAVKKLIDDVDLVRKLRAGEVKLE